MRLAHGWWFVSNLDHGDAHADQSNFQGAQRTELVVSTIDLYSWFLEDNNGFKVFGNRGGER